MKLKTLALLLATAISAAHAHAAYSYTAEGVNTENYSESERFYDSAKGLYWQNIGLTAPYESYEKADQTFSFLGDLANRVPEAAKSTTYETPQALYSSYWNQHLKDDAGTCWYQTSSNIIQHWQTYYGVFAREHETLPYGHTYGKENLDSLWGIQSLNVGMVFYDNINPIGANLNTATDWYFSGAPMFPGDGRNQVPYQGKTSEGGYFSDYFGTTGTLAGFADNLTAVYGYNETMNQQEASSLIITAMGQKIENGSLTTETKGQLAYLGISTPGGAGHAITCYGFEVEDDHIKRLLVTNSDDTSYGAFNLYMKKDSMLLYEDEECTRPWTFNYSTWTLNEISHIKTPQTLKDMYADYTAAETAMEWNGHSNTWKDNFTTEELPTETAGWDVYVDASEAHKNYYNSYYSTARKVEFGDRGKANAAITVEGQLKTTDIKLNATDNTGYSFTGKGTDAVITVENGALTKSSAGTDSLHNLTLQAQSITLQRGDFLVGTMATLEAASALIESGASLSIDGLALIDSITVQNGGEIILATGGQLGADITMEAGAILTLKLINPATMEEILGSMVFDTATNLVMEAPEAVSTRSAVMLRSAAVLGSATTSSTISLEDFVQKANAEMDILQNGQARLVYSNGAMQLQAVPEPTTATLSLLALAALAARRRRRR